MANSTNSYYKAVLAVPYAVGSRSTGIQVPGVANFTILPRPLHRNTSIVSIKPSALYGNTTGGNHGPGSQVYIDVEFSDVTIISQVRLRLLSSMMSSFNVGRRWA